MVRYSVSGKARAAFDEARTSGGSYSKAAELYSAAARAAVADKDEADAAAAWSMEALCHLHGGDHVLAEAAAKRSTEGDPVAWYGWEHRGTALALLGRNVEAITSFSQALRLKDVPEEARTGMKQTIAALRGVIAGKGAFKNAKKA